MIRRIINILLCLLSTGVCYAQTITKYEYWIDSDYAKRTEVSSTTDYNNFALSLSHEKPGVHTLNFRALGNDKIWGAPAVGLFFIPFAANDNPNAMGYEYWFDADFENRIVGTADNVNISKVVDVSSLQPGVHYFSFRVKNSEGIYGALNRHLFYIPAISDDNTKVARYEYWFDDEYAERQIEVLSAYEFNKIIDVSKLSCGIHYYSFRAQNTDGKWGGVKRSMFYIPAEPDKKSLLGGYEYWLDDDYAHRTSSFSTNPNVNLKVNLSELSQGVHYFTFREKDTNMQWSAPYRSIFYVGTPEVGGAGNIIAYRYQFNSKTTYIILPGEQSSYSIENLIIPFPETNEFATVNEESNFTFADELVTLKRKVNASFNIQFEDKAYEWTMPVFKAFDIDDELQRIPVKLNPEDFIRFDKFPQGDFFVAKITINKGGYYYVRSTQLANILFYKDGEIFNNTVSPEDLRNCAMIGLDPGTYYAVVYNTVRDNDNSDDNVGIKLSVASIPDIATGVVSGNITEPCIWVSGNSIFVNSQNECDIKVYYINGTVTKILKAEPGITEIKGLSPGPYIINGKKILIK